MEQFRNASKASSFPENHQGPALDGDSFYFINLSYLLFLCLATLACAQAIFNRRHFISVVMFFWCILYFFN